jgi:hypothetical protein|tara:strand:+ start:9278 stop:10111 length:834 start_codon:yes stop_codon:yes gene_type:complete
MFKLTVGNQTHTKDLFFKVLDTDIAHSWANEISKNYTLYETDRFTDWPGSIKNKTYYEICLKQHINIINQYDPQIRIYSPGIITQEYFNELHKNFEDLRGHIDFATKWYSNSPDKVKQSVDRLNILIHEYENLLDSVNNPLSNPTVVGTYHNRPVYNLEDHHYDLFTYKWKFGTVYINYCEVGKPLLDVFKDQDEHVGSDAVRPQSTWSADFMIKFGKSIPLKYVKQRETAFNTWYDTKEFNFKHKSLGMIPVATISNRIDINKFSGMDRIVSTCIE